MSTLRIILTRIRNIPSQPCCGYFLHGGTRVVGILDFSMSLFTTILIASEVYQSFGKLQTLYQNKEYYKYYFRAASWASYFTYTVMLLALSVLLFRAAKKRSSRLCKVWLIFSIITSTGFFAIFYTNHYLFTIAGTIHIFVVFLLVYKFYCFHVVRTFIKEIESYGGFNAALSGLTDAEVEEFEKGCPPERDNDQKQMIQNMAFNKDFEIFPENLEIDESSVLGSGAFGCVYRGKLTNDSGAVKCVAVKTVSQTADVAYFKTLLQELKVMTFVFQHENVVGLLGACTANIKQKKLYMVVEFCPFGNLHEFLKARRGLFVNFVKNGEIRTDFKSGGKFAYTNINAGNTVTTLDIFKWMQQSSNGLEYLEEKKVIHGDIAARNILLGYGKIAKISDFGLSKKLYQYTTIVKEEGLLPWRWMALESLADMEFSVKSDVWAFGVSIWEVFSLSELPFPGFSWDKEFVEKVQAGLRMAQPRNSTNELYELLLRCWQPQPQDRPTFKEINDDLRKMLHAACSATEIKPDIKNNEHINNQTSIDIDEEDIEMYIPNQVITSVDNTMINEEQV